MKQFSTAHARSIDRKKITLTDSDTTDSQIELRNNWAKSEIGCIIAHNAITSHI